MFPAFSPPELPDSLETVTPELEEQLKAVTPLLAVLFTQDELEALTAEISGDETAPDAAQPEELLSDALHTAALLVLRLNARVALLNEQAAQAVHDLIAALPDAGQITLDHEAQINEASAAYEVLTSTQKALLPEGDAAALAAARELLAELLAMAEAAVVDEMIALLPERSVITPENFMQFEPPARQATEALSALSEYERTFVQKADALHEFVYALDSAAEIMDVVMRLTPLCVSRNHAQQLLTFAPGDYCIDKVFEAEAAYWNLTDEEREDPLLTSIYPGFQETLQVAEELRDIREFGKPLIGAPNHLLMVGDMMGMPALEWSGISADLAGLYPLTFTMPSSEEYIRLVYGSFIEAVAPTQEDQEIQVFGANAKALKELAVSILVTVLPVRDEQEIDGKAYVRTPVITVNRNYRQFTEGPYAFPCGVSFSIGKYRADTLAEDISAGVAFTNTKIPECFSVELDSGETQIVYHPALPGATKNATYVTKLAYTIPLSGGGSFRVVSNEVKLVITDKLTKIAFKTPVVNLFYEAVTPVDDSLYPVLWLTQTKRPELTEPLVLETLHLDAVGDKADRVAIAWDGTVGQFRLVVKGGPIAKPTTWKVKVHVSGGGLSGGYDITLPITFKKAAPSAVHLEPKSVKLSRGTDQILVKLTAKKGTASPPLGQYGVSDITLAPQEEAAASGYRYQNRYDLADFARDPDAGEWALTLIPRVSGDPLPASFKLMLRVTFSNSRYVMNLPLTVTIKKPKVTLLSTSAVINCVPEPEQPIGAVIGYKTSDNRYIALDRNRSTVNGIPTSDAGHCPLELYSHDGGDYMTLLIGTNGHRVVPNKTYKMVMVFENGQVIKVSVSTKPTRNKFKLGKTAFTTDQVHPDDRIVTTLTLTHIPELDTRETLRLQIKDGKEWKDAPAELELDWEGCWDLEMKGFARLPVGKHTFRIYSDAEEIPQERGVVFTVTVKNSALAFTASLKNAKADVMYTGSDLITFTKLKLTGLSIPNGLANLDRDGKWMITLGGDGGKYLAVGDVSGSSIAAGWKNGTVSQGMKDNGLKPFKVTLQIRDKDTKSLIAASKPFTIKPVQKVSVKVLAGPKGALELHPSMPYQIEIARVDVWKSFETLGITSRQRVASVAVKGAEKSNYRAYLVGYELDDPNVARIAIGYKSLVAAQKAKSSETITLVLTLVNGVVPVEVKVPIKNIK